MGIFSKFFGFMGFYPNQLLRNFSSLPWYFNDYLKLKKAKDQDFPFSKPFPVLNEKSSESGNWGGHYLHQDLWVAQQIFKDNPVKHLDIGSRIDGFVTHVASFREIEVLDIREAGNKISNVEFHKLDITQWDESYKEYTDSVSCLHVIEHIGLGRYGDAIDPDGYKVAWDNIYKCLKPNGTFYFSTPIGPQRIEFNAHRVFSMNFLVPWISEKYEILTFSYVDDFGFLHEDVKLTDEIISNSANCKFGCGIFKLQKVVST